MSVLRIEPGTVYFGKVLCHGATVQVLLYMIKLAKSNEYLSAVYVD